MKVFYAVVNKDKDSAFGMHFPDVPGCFSASDTEEDLVSNACDALICHLKGKRLYHPLVVLIQCERRLQKILQKVRFYWLFLTSSLIVLLSALISASKLEY